MSAIPHTEECTTISGYLETCSAALLTLRYKEALMLLKLRGDESSGLVNIFDPYVAHYIHSRTTKHSLIGTSLPLGIVRCVEDFEKYFGELLSDFTNIEHDHMKHIVVAGGSVVRAIQKNCIVRDLFADSDVDIYIVGCVSETQYKEICYWLIQKFSLFPTLISTANTYTFVSSNCRVQIMKTLYHSPQDVINSFDLECCCVLYYNKTVLTNVMGLVSLRYRMNTVASITGGTTVSRLVKYVFRGYGLITCCIDNMLAGLHHYCPLLLANRLKTHMLLVQTHNDVLEDHKKNHATRDTSLMYVTMHNGTTSVVRRDCRDDIADMLELLCRTPLENISSRYISHDGLVFLIELFNGNHEILRFFFSFFLQPCSYDGKVVTDNLQCGPILDILYRSEWIDHVVETFLVQ